MSIPEILSTSDFDDRHVYFDVDTYPDAEDERAHVVLDMEARRARAAETSS